MGASSSLGTGRRGASSLCLQNECMVRGGSEIQYTVAADYGTTCGKVWIEQ